MKKFFTLVVVCLTTISTWAYDVEVDGIYYNLNASNKTAAVTYKTTSYNSYSGTVAIPLTVESGDETYYVTSIENYAFYGCSGLTSIDIPTSVTRIGSSAFKNCSGLTSVTIPISVTSIGDNAFGSCYKMATLNYNAKNAKVSTYTSSLSFPTSLKTINIGDKVESIPEYFLYFCSDLTSISIPNSVTSIGYSALFGCSGLTSLTIPNSVTSIGGYAFSGCTGLTSVIMGNSVTSIGFDSFQGCTSLTSVIIPNSVTSIDSYAFNGCTSLNSVTIGNSVTSIGGYAFSGCTGLTSVAIPNSVTSVGEAAFSDCSKLISVTIGNFVKAVESYTFQNCTSLSSVTIGNSVTSIESAAFRNCPALISITIPSSVKSIKNMAFYDCNSLTSITIPNSVESISPSAFSHCQGLASIDVESSNTVYDSRDNCNAIIEKISNSLIKGCKNSFIPSTVTSVGSDAFSGCTGLISIIIPKFVASIGGYAFEGCKDIETVACYAESVPTLGENVFNNCPVSSATLNVPEKSVDLYKAADQWKEFGTIQGIDGSEPTTKKCAKPTISYSDKKLTYDTETEGAEIISEVTVADAKKSYDREVSLTATYDITAYATKSDYENSETATATLVWATGSLTDGINQAKTISVDALPLLISQDEGMVTVSGLNDGDTITAYGADGTQVAKTKAVGASALMNLSELQGKVAVLSVNGKSAKVMIK